MQLKLVIPHYQMFQKLKVYLPELLEALDLLSMRVRIVVVDDGSDSSIQAEISNLCEELNQQYDFLDDPILLESNHGKGYAIRQGWIDAEDADFLGFIDADGSIPAGDAALFIQKSSHNQEIVSCAIRPRSSQETRSLRRKMAGRLFAFIAVRFLNLKLKDPQCGFKIVPTQAYRKIETHLKVNRFAFDCELLAYLQSIGTSIEELEIPWVESPSSTIHVMKDGFEMLVELWKLRNRLIHPGN